MARRAQRQTTHDPSQRPRRSGRLAARREPLPQMEETSSSKMPKRQRTQASEPAQDQDREQHEPSGRVMQPLAGFANPMSDQDKIRNYDMISKELLLFKRHYVVSADPAHIELHKTKVQLEELTRHYVLLRNQVLSHTTLHAFPGLEAPIDHKFLERPPPSPTELGLDVSDVVDEKETPSTSDKTRAQLIDMINLRDAFRMAVNRRRPDHPIRHYVWAKEKLNFVAAHVNQWIGNWPFEAFMEGAHTQEALRRRHDDCMQPIIRFIRTDRELEALAAHRVSGATICQAVIWRFLVSNIFQSKRWDVWPEWESVIEQLHLQVQEGKVDFVYQQLWLAEAWLALTMHPAAEEHLDTRAEELADEIITLFKPFIKGQLDDPKRSENIDHIHAGRKFLIDKVVRPALKLHGYMLGSEDQYEVSWLPANPPGQDLAQDARRLDLDDIHKGLAFIGPEHPPEVRATPEYLESLERVANLTPAMRYTTYKFPTSYSVTWTQPPDTIRKQRVAVTTTPPPADPAAAGFFAQLLDE